MNREGRGGHEWGGEEDMNREGRGGEEDMNREGRGGGHEQGGKDMNREGKGGGHEQGGGGDMNREERRT